MLTRDFKGGSVLSRAVRVSLKMRGHLIKGKREKKMNHRAFQLHIGREAKAEAIQNLLMSILAIHQASAFGTRERRAEKGKGEACEQHGEKTEKNTVRTLSKTSMCMSCPCAPAILSSSCLLPVVTREV